jgi:hypothetical protein
MDRRKQPTTNNQPTKQTNKQTNKKQQTKNNKQQTITTKNKRQPITELPQPYNINQELQECCDNKRTSQNFHKLPSDNNQELQTRMNDNQRNSH